MSAVKLFFVILLANLMTIVILVASLSVTAKLNHLEELDRQTKELVHPYVYE
jgi:hypothetical protein